MDLEIARLRRDLRAVLARRGDNPFAVRSRLARTRDVGGSALLSAIGAVGNRFDPEALHRIRIRSRRLRYTAELGEDLRGRTTRAPLLLKELQERLGHVHDHAVLAQWLAHQASLARAARRPRLAAEASAQQTWFLEEGRRHHQEYLAAEPAAAVRQAILAMGHVASAAS